MVEYQLKHDFVTHLVGFTYLGYIYAVVDHYSIWQWDLTGYHRQRCICIKQEKFENTTCTLHTPIRIKSTYISEWNENSEQESFPKFRWNGFRFGTHAFLAVRLHFRTVSIMHKLIHYWNTSVGKSQCLAYSWNHRVCFKWRKVYKRINLVLFANESVQKLNLFFFLQRLWIVCCI